MKYLFIMVLMMMYTRTYAEAEDLQTGSVYIIKRSTNNKVMSVENSSLDVNGKIQLWTNTNSNAQKWMINNIADNTYTFTNIASNRILKTTGTGLIQTTPTGSNIENWIITKVPNTNNSYTIKLAAVSTYSICTKDENEEGTYVQLAQLSDAELESWDFILQENVEPDFSEAIKETAFNSWISTYFDTRGDNEVFKGEGFWGNAEMMEIVDDAFETTGNIQYLRLFATMYNEFIQKEGTDWSWNEYNDDITWMCIACLRAYNFTGTSTYLNIAKSNFDVMYNRAYTEDELLGNGLIWKQGTRTKNACINGPAMIACCYLAKATGDNTYYDKAIQLFEWSKGRLFDTNDGHVYDAYYVNNETGEVNTNYWASTYNQGTYLGACTMLYQYTKDQEYLMHANQIADYTRNMFNNSVINGESGTDLDGFKGIYMRYARKYIQEFNMSDYIPWLQLNAKVAYNNRNSKGIIHTLWGTKTSESEEIKAFSASTAVSLLVNCPISTDTEKNPYETLMVEDFDAIATAFMVDGPSETKSLQIRNNNWVGFNNLDFGAKGPAQLELSIASGNNTGTFEVRIDSENGDIIGTAEIIPTTDFNTYTTISCNVENIKGLHHIYLVYNGTSSVMYLNQFIFIESTNPERGNGLLGEYYNGTNFNTFVDNRIDENIHFNWGLSSPISGIDNDNNSIRWTGQIEPLYSGEYTFYITSDNGRRVWIDNQLIIDKWISDWNIEYSGSIDLIAGNKYDIKVEYFEEVGGANIKLEWESNDQIREVVPYERLYLPIDLASSVTSNSEDFLFSFNIYPNPATTDLNICCSSSSIDKLSILNTQGKILKSINHIANNKLKINISDLANGLYIIQAVNHDNICNSQKFIKTEL